MGNWHCVTSDCAKLVYREYKPPSVRWRYSPSESWQEIIGADNYELEQNWYGGQNPSVSYQVKYGRAAISNGTFVGWSIFYAELPAGTTVPIKGMRLLINNVDYGIYEHWGFNWGGSPNPPPNGTRRRTYTGQFLDATDTWRTYFNGSSQGHKIYGFVPADGSVEENPGGANCTFTVYKNGQIVHQETINSCPEVEQLDCHLSDKYKEITIDKFPYLERVEVVDYAYDVKFGLLIDSNNYGLLLQKGKIPDQCLNIYKNNIVSIIPNDFLTITNTPENGFNLIAQICSIPGCPPPEYQVICDCDSNCESCPDGTCAVECGDHVCCYGSDGIAVSSIKKDNYCND